MEQRRAEQEVTRMPEQASYDKSDAREAEVPFSAEFGLSASAARAAIESLARVAGYGSGALTEWSSADVPGAPLDLAPLYYAAWLPVDSADDLPLGLGGSPAEALADLLWALGAPALATSLWDDRDEPLAEETDTPLWATSAR
jgi:hypothetical protein